MSSVCEPRTGQVWASQADRRTLSLLLPKPVSTTDGNYFSQENWVPAVALFVDGSDMFVWYIVIPVVVCTSV